MNTQAISLKPEAKLFKYIDDRLNSYTPVSSDEAAKLKADGWTTDPEKAYEIRKNNSAPSDRDFRVNANAALRSVNQ